MNNHIVPCVVLFVFIGGCFLVRPDSASAVEFKNVKSWVYQLTDYKNNKLDEIANAGFDLAVFDLSRDGGTDYFAREEVEAVKKKGAVALSYFAIGSIETYRPEWNRVPSDMKAGKVEGWPNEQYVKFWDERWWPVVQGRIDQALKAGFDGAYLDLITAYDEIPLKAVEGQVTREELARRMVALIVRISKYAKSKNPNFKILPQNCPELYSWSFWNSLPNRSYIDAIDGIGLESVFYLAHDKPAKEDWCAQNRDNAVKILKAGKLVLGVDYAKKPETITDSYKKIRALGFVPYVSVVELNIVAKENEAASMGLAPRKQKKNPK